MASREIEAVLIHPLSLTFALSTRRPRPPLATAKCGTNGKPISPSSPLLLLPPLSFLLHLHSRRSPFFPRVVDLRLLLDQKLGSSETPSPPASHSQLASFPVGETTTEKEGKNGWNASLSGDHTLCVILVLRNSLGAALPSYLISYLLMTRYRGQLSSLPSDQYLNNVQ